MKKIYIFLLSLILSVPAMLAGDDYFYIQNGEVDDFDSVSGEGPGVDSDQPGEGRSQYAVITQIEKLQWKVSWEDYDIVNSTDSEFNGQYAVLTSSTGKRTTLVSNLHGNNNANIIFPDYGNYFTVNLEGLGLADGTYTLSIPYDYVRLVVYGVSTEANPAQNLSLTVGDSPDISYNVQIGAIRDNYFYITWENVTSLAEGNTKGAYMQNVSTKEKYDLLYLEDYMYSKANLRIEYGNTLCVNVTNNYPDLPTGTYRFYIPADYVKFNGTKTGNDAVEGQFDYTKPWNEGKVEFNGPSVDNKITLTWVDASEILYDTSYAGDGNKIVGVTIYDSNDAQINVSYADNISISKNVMTIDLDGLKIAEGECRVMVPEDCLFVTVNGETDYTAGASFTFTFGNPEIGETPDLYNGPATWNIQSGSTVKGGTFVEVGWGAFELSIVDGAEQASIHNFERGVLYLEYGKEVYLSKDKTKLVLDLSNQPNDTFRINVAEACVEFKVENVTYRNQATSMDNVTVDNNGGVAGVVADNDGRYRVVNLSGVVVLDTDKAGDVNNLPSGFYIVNGKKVNL